MITALTKIKTEGGITKYVKDLRKGDSVLTYDTSNGMCLYSKITDIEKCLHSVSDNTCIMVNVGNYEFICDVFTTEMLVTDNKGFTGMLSIEKIILDTNTEYSAIRSVGKPLAIRATVLETAVPLYSVVTEVGNLIMGGLVIGYQEPVYGKNAVIYDTKNDQDGGTWRFHRGSWGDESPSNEDPQEYPRGGVFNKETIDAAYEKMVRGYVPPPKVDTEEPYISIPTTLTGRTSASKEVVGTIRNVYDEGSDDWNVRMSYYNYFGFTKKAFGDIHWEIRLAAYREFGFTQEALTDEYQIIRLVAYRKLGFTEKAFTDEYAGIRLAAYRKLGFTCNALKDVDCYIVKRAKEYFERKRVTNEGKTY